METPTPPRFLRSQRWRERRQRLVPNASIIDPREFSVDVISRADAAAYVKRSHYTRSYVASKMAAGLFRNGKGGVSQLVGVAAFSNPMTSAVIPCHTGLPASQGLDLGRLVLDHDVAGNGESYFVARAWKLLRSEHPAIQAFTAFADPLIRRDADGHAYQIGHCGQLYASLSAHYRGRSSPRTLLLLPDGRTFSARAASKIRNYETGHAYAVDQLVEAGAAPPALNADLRDWYDDLAAGPFFQRLRHPGSHVFSFPLTLKARLASRALPALRPPRRNPAVTSGDVTALPLLERAV